jgi:GNAT superfamily N-acetyltransferase
MNIRPITDSDIGAVAVLAAEDESALQGRSSHLGPNDVRGWLARVDLAQDSWLYEDEGELVAASWFDFIDDLGVFIGIVGQGAKGRGLGSRLVDIGEARARERVRRGCRRSASSRTLLQRIYPTLWFLVREGDEIAGVIRNDPERSGGGYVGAVGVRRAWRGNGVGRVLLLRTFAEFYSRGVSRVTLGVDAESPTGATKLYEGVGMTIEMAAVVYEKALT